MGWRRWVPWVRWPCWRGHEPRLTHARTPEGRPLLPPRVIWICNRCGRELGETVLRLDMPAKR